MLAPELSRWQNRLCRMYFSPDISSDIDGLHDEGFRMKPIQAVVAIGLNIDLNELRQKTFTDHILHARYMKTNTKLGIDKDFGL